jgi:hypothetical protein
MIFKKTIRKKVLRKTYFSNRTLSEQYDAILVMVAQALPDRISVKRPTYEGILQGSLFKGTVQRKLTGVESDINRKVFLSH